MRHSLLVAPSGTAVVLVCEGRAHGRGDEVGVGFRAGMTRGRNLSTICSAQQEGRQARGGTVDRGRSTVVHAAAPCCCVLRVSMALRPAQWRCLDYLELMKGEQSNEDGADILTLRFVGGDGEGHELHELRAAHVAEVLEGLVGLAGDFGRAGAFGVGPPPEVLVRPPSEGSFVIEVVNWFAENKEPLAVVGVPSLGSAIWWATKSLRAEVSNFEHLENGKVKVQWQDNTVEEIPRAAWDELNKRKPRRKTQLRKIMAPLSDGDVTALQVSAADESVAQGAGDAPREFTLERIDYNLARPEDEIEETQRIFESEARMAAIDSSRLRGGA